MNVSYANTTVRAVGSARFVATPHATLITVQAGLQWGAVTISVPTTSTNLLVLTATFGSVSYVLGVLVQKSWGRFL